MQNNDDLLIQVPRNHFVFEPETIVPVDNGTVNDAKYESERQA